MITESMLYWITRLDGIKGVLEFVPTIIGVFTFIGACICISEHYSEGLKTKGLGIFLAIVTTMLFLLSCSSIFIATTKEMAMIYVLPKVSQSDFIEKSGKRAEMIADVAFNKLENILGIEKEKNNE